MGFNFDSLIWLDQERTNTMDKTKKDTKTNQVYLTKNIVRNFLATKREILNFVTRTWNCDNLWNNWKSRSIFRTMTYPGILLLPIVYSFFSCIPSSYSSRIRGTFRDNKISRFASIPSKEAKREFLLRRKFPTILWTVFMVLRQQFLSLDYISLWGISKCGDQKKGVKIELGPKMYDVFTHLSESELFLPMTCNVSFKYIADTKYDLIHKYDHYNELFHRYCLHTLVNNVMIFTKIAVGLAV